MFEKVRDILDLKFKVNQLTFEAFYPGINLGIFIREFLTFYGEGLSENSLVDSKVEKKLNEFIQKTIDGIPFEYISGIGHFYGRDFIVGQGVLIPRQETEIIIEEVCNIKKVLPKKIKMLDLCAGSGCIGLSIACELNRQIESLILSDISETALKYLRINVEKFKYQFSSETKIEVISSDLYESIDSEFDLIVTNPPYIRKIQQVAHVHDQVIAHEPHVALFVDDTLYDKFFEKIINESRLRLRSGGFFFMEGHEFEVEKLFRKWKVLYENDSVEIIKDLTGRDRFLKVKKGLKNG